MATGKTFFSYARADSVFVLMLAKDLRDAGVPIWLDQLDIKGGNLWDTAIETALNAASNVIVVLSTASVKSTNVMDEVSFALESGKTVIPVLLNECNIPFRLRRLQRIDFTGDYQTGLNKLFEVLNQTAISADSGSLNFTEEEPSKETVQQVSTQSTVSFGEQSSAAGKDSSSEEVKKNKQAQNVLPENAKYDQELSSKITEKLVDRKYFFIGAIAIIAGLVIWAVVFFDSSTKNNITDENVAAPDTSQQIAPAKQPVSIPVPDNLQVGELFMGGIVLYFYFSEDKHGLLISPDDYTVQSTSLDSISFCKELQMEIMNYKIDGFDGWRLPTLEELRSLYEAGKNVNDLNLNDVSRKNNRIGLYASAPDSNCQAVSKDFKTGREIFGSLNRKINYRLVRSF